MGSETRVRLALIGLGGVVLLTFNQLFEQQDFAGPALLAMMASVGVALIGRRLGLWPSTTIFLSLVCMGAYLCLIFQISHTFYGLPTLGAFRALGRSINAAYGHSQVDFAPVPLRAGYAVLATAAMWTLVTIGEVAAFRWRRPVVAVIPSIALFAFLQIVGTQEASVFYLVAFLTALFAFWALDSAHRTSAWGPTARVASGRRTFQPPPVATGLARKMGASCVAAALVLPVFLPALEDGLVSWRTKNGAGGFGAGSGATAGGRVDPLVSLVPQLISQTDRELFRVRADRPEYWRLITLTRFDGEKWTRGSVGQVEIDPSGLTPFESRADGITIREDFVISELDGNELPIAGFPRTIVGPAELEGRLRIDPATSDVTLSDGDLEPGLTYSVQATLPDATFQDLKDSEVAAPPTAQYLETPELSEAVRELSNAWTEGAETDVEKLVAIQSRLRAFDYSIDLEKPTTSDYLEEFLLETRVGYCQQFATAFAVLARNLGFPTRVVVGFLPGETDISTPNNYVVTGNETHAWPEVLFEGYGWIRFEPTPRREASPPAYTVAEVGSDPATIAGAEAPTGGGRGGEDAGPANANPNNRALNADARRQRREARAAARDAAASKWQDTFGRIALVLAIGLVLYLTGVPLLKRGRLQARYARARGPRSAAAAAFAELEAAAAALASPRHGGESASRYAQRIAKEATVPAGPLLRLASIYEAAEYAPSDISPQVADEARRLVRRIKSQLWANAGWWERAKAVWSPAELLPRRRGLPRGLRSATLQRLLSLSRS